MGAFSRTFSAGSVSQGALLNLPPSILYDGNTVAWYDYAMNTTLTKDANNLVSRWNDKLGSGRDLIQLDSVKQPLWTDSGILFDGVNDRLKSDNFTYVQPEQIYLIVKPKSWTDTDQIFDGSGGNSGALRQRGTTPSVGVFAGTWSDSSQGLILNSYSIVEVLFNGSDSRFIVNDESEIIGSFGTLNMNGFTIGSSGGDTQWSNIEVKEIILRKIADSENKRLLIKNYLKKKF